jgi:hypothetical protein
MRKIAFMLAILFLSATAFAMLGNLFSGISQLCSGITGVLPVVSMLMIVFAAVVYAAGQIMGAETRARANVWATTSLTGAVLGVMIVSVAPALLTQLYGPSISCGGSGGSGGACGAGPACSASQTCCAGTCVNNCGPFSACCPPSWCADPVSGACAAIAAQPNGASCTANSQCLSNNCCCVGVCGPGTCASSCGGCGSPC